MIGAKNQEHFLEKFSKVICKPNSMDHIICAEAEFNRISEYIIFNSANWEKDYYFCSWGLSPGKTFMFCTVLVFIIFSPFLLSVPAQYFQKLLFFS